MSDHKPPSEAPTRAVAQGCGWFPDSFECAINSEAFANLSAGGRFLNSGCMSSLSDQETPTRAVAQGCGWFPESFESAINWMAFANLSADDSA